MKPFAEQFYESFIFLSWGLNNQISKASVISKNLVILSFYYGASRAFSLSNSLGACVGHILKHMIWWVRESLEMISCTCIFTLAQAGSNITSTVVRVREIAQSRASHLNTIPTIILKKVIKKYGQLDNFNVLKKFIL